MGPREMNDDWVVTFPLPFLASSSNQLIWVRSVTSFSPSPLLSSLPLPVCDTSQLRDTRLTKLISAKRSRGVARLSRCLLEPGSASARALRARSRLVLMTLGRAPTADRDVDRASELW